jgi:ribulose-bisphosphate carboxylase large chain
VTAKLIALYRIRADASAIDNRALAIAVEQSVEMPVTAISDSSVLEGIVGTVQSITDCGDGSFDARVALNVATTGFEAGQLLNVLFGNSSIHDDVTLQDVILPPELTNRFTGPRHGPTGLRSRVDANMRALTCSALKPQGLSPDQFAALANHLALGGLDYIKDDHSLADQPTAPFAARVKAVANAIQTASQQTGKRTRYLPNVSGNLDTLRLQVRIARDHGIDTLLIAPMVVGLPSFHTLVRENADMAFIAHPAMAGAARIAPAALYGKLFRMIGADGVIFPNNGGRFGYSAATCQQIALTALQPWPGVKPSLPVPAGGMKLASLPAILQTYGHDAMLLIGGDLLAAGSAITTQARAFQTAVETHKSVP